MNRADLDVLRVLVLEAPGDSTLCHLLPPAFVQVSSVPHSHRSRLPEVIDEAAPDVVVAEVDACPPATLLDAARRCPDTPFVALAAESADSAQLIALGIEDVVPQTTLTPARLLAAITHAVARRRRAAPDLARPRPALREGDPRFRALAEASPSAIVIAQNGRITYTNPTVAALAGRRRRDLIGIDPMDLVHEGDRQRVEARRSALMRGDPGEVPIELRLATRNGEECWLEVTTAQIVYDGGAAVVATGIDVTPRRRLEARMQQARQLESVGRLAGGVAHDFNNLLLVIGGETECLLDGLPSSSPMRGSLEAIARASERAASLTEQLLAFGRRQFLIARPTSVNEVVLELEAALRREGVGVSLRLATGLPPVHVDRARLDRVLANLVSNARDAADRAGIARNGLLTISTDLVQVDDGMRQGRPWLPDGAWVRLQVADNGPGIPPDVLPHVFEPFFSTKDGGPATGLGLSTVYGIVKQSDGFVWIDSDPGAGARVTILLPPAVATLAAGPADPAPASEAPRVLLVEDEDGVRSLLTNVLRREGFAVSSAATAEAALALAVRQPFDVLLTDVVLPGMRGPDLAARLTGQLPHLRVLFMSGYTGEAILDAAGPSAQSAFIQKPFGSRALVARLRALLNGA